MSSNHGHHWWRWILGGALSLVVVVVGGVFVYIHFIEGPAPAKLSINSTAAPGATLTAKQIDGTWTVGAGSLAGYRVQEVLTGQNNTAVGRGSGVTGSLQIAGTKVTKAGFTVNLTTVKSDSGTRDAQFNGRIMDTAQFPDAVFALTQPIDLGGLPRQSKTLSVKAVGTLKMHGVTKPVTASLEAIDTGSSITVTGQIPVVFADWNIANPSFGSFVKTDNNGIVEFKLITRR